jgi:hypothetical protein
MKALSFLLLLTPWFSNDYQEEKFKALFITKFIEYIEWPASSQNTVGVYSSSAVQSELQALAPSKGFQVVQIKKAEDLGAIKVLYVPNVNESKAKEILAAVGEKPILVVSDQKDSAGKAADIGFYVSDGKLRFVISKSRIEKKKMLPSSKLLALGDVI